MAESSNVVVGAEEVRNQYELVRSDGDATTWIALEYDDKSIVIKSTGQAYDDLLPLFTEEARIYAYCRFTTGDEMSIRAKFAFITWIGPGVSPLKKAKVSTDKAFVKEIFKEFSVEILADDIKELAQDEVVKKLVTSSGAKY